MAKLSMKLKQSRPAKFSTRAYTRCRICGRPHSVLRKYGVCRVCFRELAYKGEIPGVKKAYWLFTGRRINGRISAPGQTIVSERYHYKTNES